MVSSVPNNGGLISTFLASLTLQLGKAWPVRTYIPLMIRLAVAAPSTSIIQLKRGGNSRLNSHILNSDVQINLLSEKTIHSTVCLPLLLAWYSVAVTQMRSHGYSACFQVAKWSGM